ncbi:N-6 DNA methylase [Roseomonas sp. CECT 9278]|uniref:N-6 DNA methylase n=1 Tax=Roseomonas sp. CECT 9278 TaxID=2845823 RepID=UPI001E3BA362|nr:N-6 DNA methylase [Roseomonas sp. CECT 9278]CAH0215073.1 hypothetical protein ROS9278_02261 [Roseomonas sp. CECT 9278]
MPETNRRDWLRTIAANLAQRPGHEAVRVGVSRLLTDALGVRVGDVTHEYRMPLVGGRADALFGATVFEFKSDLRREKPDVLAKMPDYLAEHERQTGRRPALGIATDGATFIAYELREGVLTPLGEHKTSVADPEALLGWLEPAVSDRDDLAAEPLTIQRELGRESLTFRRASESLKQLWATLKDHPEVKLKRDLWDGLLREVYGEPVGEDTLFLQHTYLTILAKTIAARVLDRPAEDAEALLSGRALDEIGIHGAVESDFFDWVLEDPAGHDLVRRLARQAARFRLRDVQSDVLKALYESLMDPEQRHDLGEYYTPDWLAAKVSAAAMDTPLTQRVLDPACGSGTFLFHAIRRLRAAGETAGWPPARRVAACTSQVRGLDVHPVAVIIARVTWLLALGEDIHDRDGDIHVPVFLGDALQWNISQVGDSREVRVNVPEEAQPLRVPAGFAEDQALLDAGVQALKDGLERDAAPAAIERDLRRLSGAVAADAVVLAQTYARVLALHRAGRDGIWPFVLRNLVRPLWLSRADQRADVLLGNPPWVAYRHLSAPMQARMKAACQELNLWVGGVLATQQDLCALFTVRAVQRYLKPGGRVAFVLPYAVLNRPVFAGLRRGDHRQVQIAWDAGWSLDETVRPLFPVPASVMFGRRAACGVLPATVRRFEGALPRRDASEAEADEALRVEAAVAWPPIPTLAGASPYRARFKNGATIYPRRFWLVERESGGRLGASLAAPLVRGRIGGQDKVPWKLVEPPKGPVEREFLRPVLLGESLAPFRVLAPVLGVVPVDAHGAIMDATAARREGYPRLGSWLDDCEGKWREYASKSAAGTSTKMSLNENLDHLRKLSQQFPLTPLRVAYAKAGVLFASAVIRSSDVVVDHMAYWASARSEMEARYLCSILNSDRLRQRIEAMQPKGQGGARHFDNLIWELPIPDFDSRDPLHLDLAALAEDAERVAAAVVLEEGAYFTTHRRAIRDALDASGVAARLDALVARLPGL